MTMIHISLTLIQFCQVIYRSFAHMTHPINGASSVVKVRSLCLLSLVTSVLHFSMKTEHTEEVMSKMWIHSYRAHTKSQQIMNGQIGVCGGDFAS